MSWDVSYLRHASTASRTIYYPPGVVQTIDATLTIARDTLYLAPWYTGHGGVLSGVGMGGFTTSSQTVRIGVFARISGVNPAPGTRLLDCGSLIMPSGGSTTWVTGSHDLYALTPHSVVWIGLVVNSHMSTLRGTAAALPGIFGPGARTDLNFGDHLFTASWGFASGIPATAPTSIEASAALGYPAPGLAVSSIVPT